ncbi:MAG: thioredoxin family protein [Novosphingobium sp.]|nr:thioredoxin family protein [Novosphingobium sp.]
MRCYRLLVAVLWQLLALCLLAGTAQAAPTNIKAELVAEAAAKPGETVTLAIHMTPDPGWHGYWLNPGDAGFGMGLNWTLPSGATAGTPEYPVPHTLLISGLMNHVFEKDYAVLVPLTLPSDAKPGARLPITVRAEWLACTDEVCVPESATLDASIAVGASGTRDPRFDAWRAALPAPLGTQAHFTTSGQTVRIAIPLPASVSLDRPHFFIAEDKVADYAAPQVFRRKGDMLIVELQRPRVAPENPETLTGVLRLDQADLGLEVEAIPGPVPSGGDAISSAATAKTPPIVLLLLGALAGGLLLNVMPCVFPILSLKALSLARAGESEAQARGEGLAYTAGVVLACLGLGALMLALRAGGEEIGWAFQLQEPGVVAILLFLAVAITANFLGLFEFAVPGFATAGSPQGAFATGLLAAFAATPCTGPFMAAAMGAALLLPVPQALLLFATLGLGIALPFLAVAFVPALRSRLPRPGPWMIRFRRWMAVPMGLTALALLWLASRLGGSTFALASAAIAIALVLVLALIGARQRKGLGVAGLASIGLIALVAVAALALPRTVSSDTAASESLLAVQPFSQQALDEARRQGKPVFAWFTADWCITCKVNEQVAIEREDVRDAFAKSGVVVLRGDWTRRDPAITRYLTARGAAGVPLYVWYPAKGEPRQLPQVLTPGSLTELVE